MTLRTWMTRRYDPARPRGATSRAPFWLSVSVCLLMLSALAGCTLPGAVPADSEAQTVISGPPVVTITSPLNQARYLTGVNVNVLAAISNAGADINRVEISVDGVVIATIPTPNAAGAASFSVTQTWPAGAAGQHAINVTAYRASGESSAPASVTVDVVAELPRQTTATFTPAPATATVTRPAATATSSLPTATTAPSNTATPEASATSAVPRVVSRGVNVRRGPGTNFEPPIGVLAVGETADILAFNSDATWFKIRFGSGDGWVFRNIVDVEGNIDNLPREAGPATPIPPTVTTAPAVQPTATGGGSSGGSGANLIIENFVFSPKDPFCNQNAQAQINIGNIGNQATGVRGFISVATENTDGSNRQVLGTVEIPTLNAGQRNFLVLIDFKDTNVSNRADGIKRSLIIMDANNQIPESNDNDNTAQGEFALGVPCQ